MKHYDEVQSTVISPEIEFRRIDEHVYKFTARKFGRECTTVLLGFDRADPDRNRKIGKAINDGSEVIQNAVRAFHDFIVSCECSHGFDSIYTADHRAVEMISYDACLEYLDKDGAIKDCEVKYILI